jgi:hypothetical protein
LPAGSNKAGGSMALLQIFFGKRREMKQLGESEALRSSELLVKKFLKFHRIKIFIAVFTKSHQWFPY